MTSPEVSELRLAEMFEAKAKAARKTECVPAYQAYWRGYAAACDEAATMLRARSEIMTVRGETNE